MSSENLSGLVISYQFSLGLQNECGPRLHLGKKGEDPNKGFRERKLILESHLGLSFKMWDSPSICTIYLFFKSFFSTFCELEKVV